MKLSQKLVVSAAMALAIQDVINSYCDGCIALNRAEADMQNRFAILEMNKAIAKGTFNAESHADMLIWRSKNTDSVTERFQSFKNGLEATKFPFVKEIKTTGMVYTISMEMSEDQSEVSISYDAVIEDGAAMAILELLPDLMIYITKVYQTSFREVPIHAIDAFSEKMALVLNNDMDSDAPSADMADQDAA